MSNVHGLGTFRNESQDSRDDDENRLYVGGASQHGGGSGLNVIGHPENASSSDSVQNIFARAMAESGSAAGTSNVPPRIITFYQNGFTVDQGPLRAKTDPANASFLNDMQRGIVPRELESQAQNEQVGIHVIDKRQEQYVLPAYTAFGGEGQTMGGGQALDGIIVGADESAMEKPDVNTDAPTTVLQIRLHNGTRLRETLNLSHTVQDLQTIIRLAGAGAQPYVLMAGYPPKPITDMAQSIEAAGLKGAAITQKLA